MFHKDQPICSEWAADSEKIFFDTIMFVSISIRQQTHTLEQLMFDFQQHGEQAKGLFGYKFLTLDYAEAHCERLWKSYRDYMLPGMKKKSAGPEVQTLGAMMEYSKIPGLGLPKAGFLTTLLLGTSWCLDTNNRQWFDLDPRKYIVTPKTAPLTRYKKINNYIIKGEELGGTEALWNNWCREISNKYPGVFPEPKDVSSLHWRVHDQIPFIY